MEKEDVIKLMESSLSPDEWNKNCDEVKKRCNGYPPFWYKEIIMGGVYSTAKSNWSNS